MVFDSFIDESLNLFDGFDPLNSVFSMTDSYGLDFGGLYNSLPSISASTAGLRDYLSFGISGFTSSVSGAGDTLLRGALSFIYNAPTMNYAYNMLPYSVNVRTYPKYKHFGSAVIDMDTMEVVRASNNEIYNPKYTITKRKQVFKPSPKKYEGVGTEQNELYGINRSGWQLWSDFNQDKIYMFPNPTNYSLTLPMRGQTNKIHGGTTFSWWHNPITGSYIDNGTLQLTMQTGNIMPMYKRVNRDLHSKGVPYGLYTLYRYLSMLDEPKIIQNTGVLNYVHLFYSTYAFPGILIEGVLSPDEQFTISENADSLFNLEYTITIIINRVYPSFSDLDALVSTYSQAQWGSNQNGESYDSSSSGGGVSLADALGNLPFF